MTVEYSNAAGIASAQELCTVANENCDTDVSDIVKVWGSFVAGMTCSQAGA